MIDFLFAAVALASPPPQGAAEALHTDRGAMVLHLHAPPERAFAMFDPIGEKRWSPKWNPVFLGPAAVTTGTVFTTGGDEHRSVWLVDRYDPATGSLRYVVVDGDSLTTIDVAVSAAGTGDSVAAVSLSRTPLEASAALPESAFTRHVAKEAVHWEEAINAALARGT